MTTISDDAIRRAMAVGGASAVEAMRNTVRIAGTGGHHETLVAVPGARALHASSDAPSQCHAVTLLMHRDHRDAAVSWRIVDPEWPTSDAAWSLYVFWHMRHVVGWRAPVEIQDACPTLADALRRLPGITDAATLREWRRALHAAMIAWDTDGEREACDGAAARGHDRPLCVIGGINALRAALVWTAANASDLASLPRGSVGYLLAHIEACDLSPMRYDAVRAWERHKAQRPPV